MNVSPLDGFRTFGINGRGEILRTATSAGGPNANGTFLFILFGCLLSRTNQEFDSKRNPEEQRSAEGPKNWRWIRLNRIGTAPEVLVGPFRDEAQQAKFLWSVERMTHRGLPDNFGSVRRRPLAAKQIDSKLVAN